MNFFKRLLNENSANSVKNIPDIEPIVVQAIERLFPDADTQKNVFKCIREFKKDRKGVADLKTLLALLKYSKGDLELFRKSAWQSHPHFWMDEIEHIFPTMKDAEEWVKSIMKS